MLIPRVWKQELSALLLAMQNLQRDRQAVQDG
jgi:hypothetical protein